MRARLLDQVADRPEWVEARCALLRGGQLFGDPGAAAIPSLEGDLLCVVGRPGREILDQALAACDPYVDVLAQESDAPYVASVLGSRGAAAIIHAPGRDSWPAPRLDRDYELTSLAAGDLDWVGENDEDLRDELASALERTPVAAIAVDGRPVSFCYPGSTTERWWDVSIDTLEPYRRQGFAAAAFAAVAERMQREHKLPVWGAYVTNQPSLHLARKLRFAPLARIFVWTAHRGGYRPGDEE